MWGAEMGANEHGLAIGNEAVFTRVPCDKRPRLIGMDLLRLALERARSAARAVEVITDLLAAHGQGGNCGYLRRFFYHNSFLMADPGEAWVLETAGPHWAAKRVRGVYTISNGLTIEGEWDASSPDLVDFAVKKGWCRKGEEFSFARCYSDRTYTRLSGCRSRQARTRALLEGAAGGASPLRLMEALRDHGPQPGSGPGPGPGFRPDRGLGGSTVCMHAGVGPVRRSQTTGSLVSVLDPAGSTHFATGTAAPCLSVFKPLWIDAGLPDLGPEPSGTWSEGALFWRHERYHRTVLADYEARAGSCAEGRDELERRFVAGALARAGGPREERLKFSRECFAEADEAEMGWTRRAEAVAVSRRAGALYTAAWRGRDRRAGLPS
jgi:dipeptidase